MRKEKGRKFEFEADQSQSLYTQMRLLYFSVRKLLKQFHIELLFIAANIFATRELRSC